ncbi:hypothetical protein [Lysinibacillus sp. SGAir0095]|uniref:hypothetical protein n=1 Tax=Lysinibacillus sp. SGAir0095 TaxID=2070463 RepID=UPI0010CCB85B|nr:hypothetical protein [Lysinibacillus sp. SGAir0095]QCR32341.1 hypothetical protein C1N55_09205 [Lysinibacillus sp. SGAir0095]
MEFFIFIVPTIFSILWFYNLVQLIEKVKEGKGYHNQKILGCAWSAGFTVSLIYSLMGFL